MQAVSVREPRSDVVSDLQKNHIVLQGGQRYTEQVNPADSWGSAGTKPVQALWTIYPPSTQTIVDRLMRLRCYVEVKAIGGDFQVGTNDAPRQMPIHSMTDVLTVQVNGESISDNIGDKIGALLTYGNDPTDRNQTWSQTPSMPDSFQQLNDWTTYGSAKNPLADYGENSAETPRGGFPYEVVDARTLRYIVTEPIIMSPFYDGLGCQVEGFVNVNQFNIAYRFKSDVSKFWTHSSAGNAITDVEVTFYRAPEILSTFITPDLTQEIPRLLTLPYHKSQDYLKNVPSMAIGETRRIVSDSIKLSQIPRKMFLFVRRSRQTTNFTTSDAFAGIKRASVLWNNESGLLSNATQQDLHEISRRNGCNLSWPQFSKYRGSVLCIEFGTQIGLLDNEAAGVRGQYTIQVELDVENLSGEAGWEGEFYTLMLMEGTFQISENMGRTTLGNLTADVAFNAKQGPSMPYVDYQLLRGGGFFSSLKSFVNKVARVVERGAQIAAPAVAASFPQYGPALANVSTAAKLARNLTGGTISGGRLSSHRMMKKNTKGRRSRL
jgi:hypothetical protein